MLVAVFPSDRIFLSSNFNINVTLVEMKLKSLANSTLNIGDYSLHTDIYNAATVDSKSKHGCILPSFQHCIVSAKYLRDEIQDRRKCNKNSVCSSENTSFIRTVVPQRKNLK